MSLTAFDEHAPFIGIRPLVNANGTTQQNVVSNSPLQTRIDVMLASNDDTIAHTITILAGPVGGAKRIGSASVPAGTGVLGQPSMDILKAALPPSQVGIVLDGGSELDVQLDVAMVGTSTLTVMAIGGYL